VQPERTAKPNQKTKHNHPNKPNEEVVHGKPLTTTTKQKTTHTQQPEKN
jgi:hypothetical protein